jgi:hypothetical protein
MTWHEAYRADKQCKLETRVSAETKAEFDRLCRLLNTKTSTLIRELVVHTLDQYKADLEGVEE